MLKRLTTVGRYSAKRALAPLIFRYPPIGLRPERLYLWADTLLKARLVPGAVVEIGCAAGGTAAWSSRFLEAAGIDRRYVCIDTFGGFVESQFDTDQGLGTPASQRTQFSANSMGLVRQVLKQHGAERVELVRGDITAVDPGQLPQQIAAVLLDVDLSEPIEKGLELVWPLLADGGVVLVDDCDDSDWQASVGYTRFMESQGMDPEFRFGMGIARKG
ncbi:MAG: class I SAM-dependent methyltransferase [Candidatus Nanopelagicales bacterium]